MSAELQVFCIVPLDYSIKRVRISYAFSERGRTGRTRAHAAIQSSCMSPRASVRRNQRTIPRVYREEKYLKLWNLNITLIKKGNLLITLPAQEVTELRYAEQNGRLSRTLLHFHRTAVCKIYTTDLMPCVQHAIGKNTNIMDNMETHIKEIKLLVWEMSDRPGPVRSCWSSGTPPERHRSTAVPRRSSSRLPLQKDQLEHKTMSKRPPLSHQLKMTWSRTTDTRLPEGNRMRLSATDKLEPRKRALDRLKKCLPKEGPQNPLPSSLKKMKSTTSSTRL